MDEIEKPISIEQKEASPVLEVVPYNVLIEKIRQLHKNQILSSGFYLPVTEFHVATKE